MTKDTTTPRETDGRYALRGFDRLCKCGHTLGHHTAERPHVCIEGDFGTPCDCEKFKAAKAAKES